MLIKISQQKTNWKCHILIGTFLAVCGQDQPYLVNWIKFFSIQVPVPTGGTYLEPGQLQLASQKKLKIERYSSFIRIHRNNGFDWTFLKVCILYLKNLKTCFAGRRIRTDKFSCFKQLFFRFLLFQSFQQQQKILLNPYK